MVVVHLHLSNSNARVDYGSELVNSSGEKIKTITDKTEIVSKMVDSINSKILDQENIVNELHIKLNTINELTDKNTIMVNEINQLSQSIYDGAGQLEKSVAFFKIG